MEVEGGTFSSFFISLARDKTKNIYFFPERKIYYTSDSDAFNIPLHAFANETMIMTTLKQLLKSFMTPNSILSSSTKLTSPYNWKVIGTIRVELCNVWENCI